MNITETEIANAAQTLRIILCGCAEAAKSVENAIKKITAALAAGVLAYSQEDQKEPERCPDSISGLEEFMRAMQEAITAIGYADQEPIPSRPEIPRPPKYLGPVNKTNYSHNRPPRCARSSCYIRKH